MKIDAVWRPSTHQQLFRRLVASFARPGTVQHVGDICPGQPAWLSVLATLLDGHTSLADPHGLLHPSHRPLLQARPEEPHCARFVVCDGARRPDFDPALGSLVGPEEGATLVIRVARLGEGRGLELSGPGVAGSCTLEVAGLDVAWLDRRAQWVGAFPLGVDWVLAEDERFAALPRSTRVAPRPEAR